MGAGNWSAQDQTLRLSWVKLLDYFFTPKTASFAALATRNLTTVLAGILIFCCVFGLKPVRAFLLPWFMAAASNDFKAIAAQKRLLPDSKYRNLPLENALFDCPRLECREPETRGTPMFCNPEKRLPFSSSDVQTSNLMLRKIISRARDGCYEQAY